MDKDNQINQLKSDLTMFGTIVTALIALIIGSTVFFHFVEKWKYLDSLYFTVVTISTVGYGNLVPETDIGKVVNMLLIVTGIGLFTVFVTQFVKRQGLRRLE